MAGLATLEALWRNLTTSPVSLLLMSVLPDLLWLPCCSFPLHGVPGDLVVTSCSACWSPSPAFHASTQHRQ